MLPPINLQQWIKDHREQLKPPVRNQVIWEESDFIVMAVGGPNQRTDFHTNATAEIFYQIEGDICLRVYADGVIKDIQIKQGELFFLPPLVPHQPIRGANTIGIVIEKKRETHEKDYFSWYCQKCQHKIYEEAVFVENIVTQLPVIFEHFYQSETNRTCKNCGAFFDSSRRPKV